MILEQILSIGGAVVVLVAAAMRLNILHAARLKVTFWSVSEVLGLAFLMAGCAGVVGEWFLPNNEFHSETIVIVSVALFAIGISRGQLCQVVVRLQGWDGTDRRNRAS